MKRILLISYYFPPCGGAGVQRWLRLLPLLWERGYEITVLTTKNGDYPVVDTSLMQRIPPSIKVVRTFTPVFGKLWQKATKPGEPLPYGSLDASQSSSFSKKVMYWIRLQLVYPDVRVIWNPFALRAAKKLSSEKHFDWVITTGPPHSTHLIGYALKKLFGTRWLADFRDPWTQIFYLQLNPPNRLLSKLNQQLENRVVRSADVNLVVSESIAAQLPTGKKSVFYNGFDALQFKDIVYQKTPRFRIKYIGQLTEGQDMKAILDYLSGQAQKAEITDLEFAYIGTNNPILGEYYFPIITRSHLPHQAALAEMVQSELLILLINAYADNQGMLTTKLFEYVAAKTPILCIGPLDGEAAEIILRAGGGKVYAGLTSDVWEYVGQLYHQWQENLPWRNDNDVSLWSVQQQIDSLTAVLQGD